MTVLAHCLWESGPSDTFFLEILFTKYRLAVLSHILINVSFLNCPIFQVLM